MSILTPHSFIDSITVRIDTNIRETPKRTQRGQVINSDFSCSTISRIRVLADVNPNLDPNIESQTQEDTQAPVLHAGFLSPSQTGTGVIDAGKVLYGASDLKRRASSGSSRDTMREFREAKSKKIRISVAEEDVDIEE